MRPSQRSRRRLAPPRRFRHLVLEQLEVRAMLAGIIELGPSDNIALDQPRVAMELIKDVNPDPDVEQWESVGPSVFNTFLLDTGANSVLAMATAVADMEGPPIAYETEYEYHELGVGGIHEMDISAAYRFDFAGTSGDRNTLLDTRILSDPDNDFSIFGPWGIVGMPAMVNRVTSFDMTGWSGGGTGLEDLYMKVAFADDVPSEGVPPAESHRYKIQVDNDPSFPAGAGNVNPGDPPPIWADVPFMTAIPTHHGVGQEGNFLLDTGAQISVISPELAIEIGLDSNDDGELDEDDDSFVTRQQVGGVGGTVNAPVFAIDEVRVPAIRDSDDEEVELVWTALQWLVLDIHPDIEGVFGSDLITSGWFHAFFYPGQPDGYIDKVHLDFRNMSSGSGTIYLDLNENHDTVIPPGPGIRVRHTAGSTDVAEGVGGADDAYSVVLNGAPTANVTITLGNTDGQVTAVNNADQQSNQLVFTPTDWSTPQYVRVTAEDDTVAEGPHTGVITHTVTSTDDDYNTMTVPDITVNVTDDDQLLLTFVESGGSTDVTETGVGDSYTVELTWVPTSDVYVQFDYDAAQVTAVSQRNPDPLDLFHNVLIFTSSDYAPQTVLVTAQDDSLAEGPHDTQMVHTVINAASQILGESVMTVNIADNDLGGVLITESDGGTDLSEAGGTDTYEITLDPAPTGTVHITVTADSQTHVSTDGTNFYPSRDLTFNSTNAQTITVRALDDAVAEGPHTGTITHAVAIPVNDSMYPTTLSIDNVTAAITDNDYAGLRITSDQQGQNVITSVNVAEGGTEATYWVALDSQPEADVTVFLGSVDGQVTVAGDNQSTSLLFETGNWSDPQQVHVSAVDDAIAEGVHSDQIIHGAASGDSNYQGNVLLAANVTDNDSSPTVAITRAGANPTNADAVVFDVTFSKDVENVNFSDFILDRSGVTTAALSTGDVTDRGDGDAKTFQVTVSNVAGDGTLGLDIATDTDIADLAGNALNQTPTADETYTIYNAPTIQSITSTTADGSYNAGDTINVTVTFSESVTLTGGTLDVTLDTTDVVSIAAFASSSTASGTYTVGAGDTSGDLDSTAVALSGGTLRDGAGNDATITLPGTTITDGSDIAIDTAAPTPTITGPSSPTGSDPFNVTIDFGETATGFIQGDITVGNGSVTNLTDNGNGNFTATIDVTADGQVTVDVAANVAEDQAGNANAAATQFSVTYSADQDQDGVSNNAEDGAPNGGDGNDDGTLDSQQEDVASFPNAADGTYVTLAAPAGTTLVGVTATGNPSPGDAPEGVDFPIGFFDYTVSGVTVGGSAVVTVYLESGEVVNAYYQYGPTSGNSADHWYPFMFDGETGAKIYADRIELYFVDGKRGDNDLTANGIIADPGAPGGTQFSWQNSALPEDVNCDTRVTTLDVLTLIADINSGGLGPLPTTMDGSRIHTHYPDVDPNNQLTPNDVLMTILYINVQAGGNPEGESPGQDPRLSPSGLLTDDLGQRIEIAALPQPELLFIQSSPGQTVTVDTIGDPEPTRSSLSGARLRSTFPSAGLRDAFQHADVGRTPRSNANDQDLASLDDNSLDSILEDIVLDVHRHRRTD